MRNHSSGLVLLLSMLMLTGFILPSLLYAAESGCVKCHTNERMLRSLHQPVKVVLEEGVG
ncbi:MAG: hypothetical protein GXX82_10285 [Syntrophorhabdus sp.]|jgi:hypothetical protein|nr:hypothetical protein [Syntrophorhabdus sp.]